MSTNFTISAFIPVQTQPRTPKKFSMHWTNFELPLATIFVSRSLGSSKRSWGRRSCLRSARITTIRPCFNALYPVEHTTKYVFQAIIVCLFLKPRESSDCENAFRLSDLHLCACGRIECSEVQRNGFFGMIQSSWRRCMSSVGTDPQNPRILP